MPDRVDRFGFGEEAVSNLGVARELGMQDLESDLAVVAQVHRQKHGGHSPTAKLAVYSIA